MAVTPNYGWPVPVATDYVKDGWEAISDLGNAIDTTVAGLGSGLNLISSNTITTQSTVTLNNLFSATYANYFITFNLTAASAANAILTAQLTVGGTAATGTNYFFGFLGISTAGSGSNYAANNATAFYLTNASSSYPNRTAFNFFIFDPFKTLRTKINHSAHMVTSTEVLSRFGGQNHDLANSYDGLKIICDTGTFSGVLNIYGIEGS